MPNQPAPLLPEGLVWPLIGRAAELERVAGLRASPDGRGVVLSGPAGVGKSRLAHDALAAAEADGASVTRIRATRSAATVPLGAFAGLMPADVRSDEPLELMRRSAEALQERAEGRRVVLGVDDAQLLDATSAALVLHLTETGTAFTLATLRTGEACPDAVQSLWRDAGAVRIDLRTLSEAETSALVEAVLRAPVEERARRWIHDGSRGNVLYVRELLLGALADGALRESSGFWRLTRRPPPSRSLTELVEVRMAGLEQGERSAIELLAIGEPLRLAEMVELVGTDAIVAVEERGLVRLDGPSAGDAVRAAHPLYGEVVRETMSVARAHAARIRLADLVGARPERSTDDVLRVAQWLLDAGQPIPLELSLEAAGAAIPAGAVDLGARLATQALADGGGARAALLLARAHAIYKRFHEAEAVLAEAEDEMTSPDTAMEYLEQRSLLLHWGLQQSEAALDLLARAHDWWPDASWQRRIKPMQLYFEWLNGSTTALATTEEILADPELEPSVRHALGIVHASNLFSSGRCKEACQVALRVRPSVPLRNPGDEVAFDMCCLIASESAEDVPELVDWMIAMLEKGVRIDDHAAVGIAAYNLAELRACEGRYVEAARLLGEAITQFERRDPFGYLPLTYGARAAMAYAMGDAEGVERGMRRYREARGDSGIFAVHRPYHARVESIELLALGDLAGAQRLLIEAAEQFESVPHYGIELRYLALRAGAPARTLDEAVARLREQCDSRLSAALAAHIAAKRARDGAALLRASEALEEICMTRYAAECAADAAEAFADEGREDSARRATARCRELHARGAGGWMPEIRGVDHERVVLSSREAQLADLAARGLTNAEIADRLVLSVRTVESHIYRAMQKLGLNDRRDLPKRTP